MVYLINSFSFVFFLCFLFSDFLDTMDVHTEQNRPTGGICVCFGLKYSFL